MARDSRLRPPRAAFAVLTVTLLAGCSSAAAPASPDGAFAARTQTAIEQAKEGGASAEQIALLELADSRGSVNVEDLRSAVRAVISCLADHGIQGKFVEDTSNAGVARPNYAAQLSAGDDATEGLIDQCDRENYYWINQVYTFQPTAQQATEEYFEQQLPILKRCVSDHGGGVPDSASTDTWLQAADDIAKDTDGKVNCFAVARLDSY